MKNPPTRPYSLEELEILFKESTSAKLQIGDIDLPLKTLCEKSQSNPFNLENKTLNLLSTGGELNPVPLVPINKNQNLKKYIPFIIAGIVVLSGAYFIHTYYQKKPKGTRKSILNEHKFR